MMTRNNIPTEKQECRKFIKWVSYQPSLRDYVIHIPNEGRRGIVEGVNLIRSGLIPGASDYFISLPISPYHGFFIEFKRVRQYQLSDNQKQFLKAHVNKGYAATFSFGADMTIDFVTKYLAGKLLLSDMILE